jgi:3-oxoacyl-[acyl-carrier protein] reductase
MEVNKGTVLVTGSSRGIGKAIALRLARDGFDIVVHYVNNKDAAFAVQAEIETIGRRCRTMCFDVANRDQCKQLITDDIEGNGAYHGAVCNAGLVSDNAFPAMTGAEWDRVIHTNLDSFYNVLQPLVMPMVRRRKPGRIVTIASVSGLIGNRGQTNYSAAKGGIIAATKSLAIELAKREITVNCVAPGLIDTDMVNELPIDTIKAMIPARRLGTPDEVAAAVAFLFSADAAYITRQVISVNGGLA